MNRPIKFRAWDDSRKRMFLGNPSWVEWLIGEDGTLSASNFYPYGSDKQHLPTMQFTGLHDKNGVEIYEGDIISIWGTTLKVYWEESDASFMAETLDANAMCESGQEWGGGCEVIGNIYANPEMLQEN